MVKRPDLPEDDSNFDNQPTQPYLPPEMGDTGVTRRQQAEDRTRALPAVKDTRFSTSSSGTPQPVYGKGHGVGAEPPEKPKRGQPAPPQKRSSRGGNRRDNPLSLPIWSVLLMLFTVCGAVSCIVLGVVSLGGRSAAALPPRFVIITAAPTETPAITLPLLVAAPTLVPELQQAANTPLSLSGPTLAPVIISPTPDTIGVGKTVVVNSKESGLNVRSAPGTFNTQVLFVSDDGTVFTVVDGPAQADGFTWWKIQNPTDATQSGWAASVFLQIAPQP